MIRLRDRYAELVSYAASLALGDEFTGTTNRTGRCFTGRNGRGLVEDSVQADFQRRADAAPEWNWGRARGLAWVGC